MEEKKTRVSMLKEKLQEADDEINELQIKLEKEIEQHNQSLYLINNLQNKLKNKEDELVSINDSYVKTKNENNIHEINAKKHKTQISSLQNTVFQMSETLEKLQTENIELQNRKQPLHVIVEEEVKKDGRDEEIHTLNEEILKVRNEVVKLNNHNKDLENMNVELENKISLISSKQHLDNKKNDSNDLYSKHLENELKESIKKNNALSNEIYSINKDFHFYRQKHGKKWCCFC